MSLLRPLSWWARTAPQPTPWRCAHEAVRPAFDEVEARALSEQEVRRRWPRFNGLCPTCGELVIVYASAAHFVYGDW